MNESLEAKVYSEGAMLELLGVDQALLDVLRRERRFPFVRLNARRRVYLADDVLGWLKQRAAAS